MLTLNSDVNNHAVQCIANPDNESSPFRPFWPGSGLYLLHGSCCLRADGLPSTQGSHKVLEICICLSTAVSVLHASKGISFLQCRTTSFRTAEHCRDLFIYQSVRKPTLIRCTSCKAWISLEYMQALMLASLCHLKQKITTLLDSEELADIKFFALYLCSEILKTHRNEMMLCRPDLDDSQLQALKPSCKPSLVGRATENKKSAWHCCSIYSCCGCCPGSTISSKNSSLLQSKSL